MHNMMMSVDNNAAYHCLKYHCLINRSYKRIFRKFCTRLYINQWVTVGQKRSRRATPQGSEPNTPIWVLQLQFIIWPLKLDGELTQRRRPNLHRHSMRRELESWAMLTLSYKCESKLWKVWAGIKYPAMRRNLLCAGGRDRNIYRPYVGDPIMWKAFTARASKFHKRPVFILKTLCSRHLTSVWRECFRCARGARISFFLDLNAELYKNQNEIITDHKPVQIYLYKSIWMLTETSWLKFSAHFFREITAQQTEPQTRLSFVV